MLFHSAASCTVLFPLPEMWADVETTEGLGLPTAALTAEPLVGEGMQVNSLARPLFQSPSALVLPRP